MLRQSNIIIINRENNNIYLLEWCVFLLESVGMTVFLLESVGMGKLKYCFLLEWGFCDSNKR